MRRVLGFLVAVVAVAAGMMTAAPSASAATHVVTIKNNAFSPAELHIETGDEVTWVNGDDWSHSVVATSPSGAFRSPALARGQTFTHRFTDDGVWFDYQCGVHGRTMGGAIVVGDAPRPPAPSVPPQPRIEVPADASLADAVARASDGTEIEVQPGTYLVDEPLVLDGRGVVLRGATGNPVDVVVSTRQLVPSGLVVTGADVRVQGLTLRNFRDEGVLVEGATGFSVRDVVIQGNTDVGVDIARSGPGAVISAAVDAPRVDGIAVRGSRGVIIESAAVAGAPRAGIWVAGSSNVSVTWSDVTSDGYGIVVTAPAGAAAQDVSVRSNEVTGKWAGIAWDGLGIRVCFTANTFEGEPTTADQPLLEHTSPCDGSNRPGVISPLVAVRMAS